MSNMPPEYPTAADFSPKAVHEHVAYWNFYRGPGSGGANHGENHNLPDEGLALVDYDIHVVSSHSTKGAPSIGLVKEGEGPMNIPVGVHVGIRLTPGGIGGSGARYKGEIRMKYVSKADWMVVFLKKVGVKV